MTPRLTSALGRTVAASGGELLAALVTERSENTFPRLPICEDESVLVTVARFADPAALALYRESLDGRGGQPGELNLAGLPAVLGLAPTRRLLLR